MPGVMDGVRVIEVAAWTYVPMAGGVLAEWGADVIKIEHPETGDPQRGLINSGMFDARSSVNFIIEHPNRNKRSVGIDLGTAEGRDVLLQLVATADVFLTNFRPAARRKLRIDVDDIRAVNPAIIYARGSGNGQRGEEAEGGGYDSATFWSRGGPADGATLGGSEQAVPMPSGAFGDGLAGLTLAGGIAAALFWRERTGQARVVDNSLLGMGAWAMSFAVAGCAAYGVERMPEWRHETAPNPVLNAYRTADGRFIQLNFMQPDRHLGELLDVIGRPDVAADPRFADDRGRFEHRQELIGILDDAFATRTADEWRTALRGIEGVWAVQQTPGELIRDPQVVANQIVRDVTAADGSTFKLVAAPLQFDEEPAATGRAPAHGEHTDEVLLELGIDQDTLIELKVKGAIL